MFLTRPPTHQQARASLGGLGDSLVFLRSGRSHRTEAKVGAGTRRPDAGDEGAPRAQQSACTAARPRLASPPLPPGRHRGPLLLPLHARACALVTSRARFKPAASSYRLQWPPRLPVSLCLYRSAIESFGGARKYYLSPPQNSNFPSPLPEPLGLTKHVLPLILCRIPRSAHVVHFSLRPWLPQGYFS